MSNSRHRGSSFDDFLKEEGIYEEVDSRAIARVIAWQIRNEMDANGITKTELAHRMETSRSQVDRLLNDKESGLTLETVVRAAKAVGKELRLELV
jgi:antitoxin component HigA of HigAB toxin-antitoxin module